MRRTLLVLLVGVVAVSVSVQAQSVSTHEIVRILSAEGDVTASDLQAAFGQWQPAGLFGFITFSVLYS